MQGLRNHLTRERRVTHLSSVWTMLYRLAFQVNISSSKSWLCLQRTISRRPNGGESYKITVFSAYTLKVSHHSSTASQGMPSHPNTFSFSATGCLLNHERLKSYVEKTSQQHFFSTKKQKQKHPLLKTPDMYNIQFRDIYRQQWQ